MRKFEQFFNTLTTVRSLVRNGKGRKLKKTIGDSTKNNRTLSVRQTIRALKATKNKKLAVELELVYKYLKPFLIQRRKYDKLKRTDAYDLAELTNEYRFLVMDMGLSLHRHNIGRILAKVEQ